MGIFLFICYTYYNREVISMEIMSNGKPIVIDIDNGEDTFDIFKPMENIDLEETQKIEKPVKNGDQDE